MITIRCSSLPRIMSCPASLEVGEVQIQSSSDNASIGTAVHEVMADIIRAGDFQMPELYPYASRNGVEVEDIRFLCWRGLSWWKKYAPSLSEIDVETEEEISIGRIPDHIIFDRAMQVSGERIFLSGHADITAYDSDGVGIVIDWKTGSERDQLEQLKGYALLKFGGEKKGAKVIVINLRENISEVYPPEGGVYTRDQLDSFADEIYELVCSESKPYNPIIKNCQYCPRRLECPAKEKLAESSVMAMASVHSNHSLTTPEQLAGLYDAAASLSRTLEQYKDALKMAVKDAGSITLPDGRVLMIEECERETIQFDGYFTDIVSSELSDENNVFEAIGKIGSENITVKKQAVIKAIRDAAPKGEKDEAEERFMKELRAAGCVKTTKFCKIVCRRG